MHNHCFLTATKSKTKTQSLCSLVWMSPVVWFDSIKQVLYKLCQILFMFCSHSHISHLLTQKNAVSFYTLCPIVVQGAHDAMHGFPELIRRGLTDDHWQINVISEQNYGIMIST